MKTTTSSAARSLILGMAFVLCLAPTPTWAAPADCSDLPPSHPRYCGPPTAIPECDVETIGSTGFECLWTPSQEVGLFVGTITVEPLGGQIDRLTIFVRDADPGDICVLEQSLEDTSDPPYEVYIPLHDERGSFWDFADGHWCEPYDPIDGQRDDPNGMPLVVDISFKAKRGTQAKITITP